MQINDVIRDLIASKEDEAIAGIDTSAGTTATRADDAVFLVVGEDGEDIGAISGEGVDREGISAISGAGEDGEDNGVMLPGTYIFISLKILLYLNINAA